MANPKGRPENLVHWKPGQSGNPAGRPPRRKYISEILSEVLEDEGIQREIARQARKKILAELDALPWAKMLEFIRDTTEGKPKQSIAVEAKGDMAITLDASIPVKEIRDGERKAAAGRGGEGDDGGGQPTGDVPESGGERDPHAGTEGGNPGAADG